MCSHKKREKKKLVKLNLTVSNIYPILKQKNVNLIACSNTKSFKPLFFSSTSASESRRNHANLFQGPWVLVVMKEKVLSTR